ncbi:hypothetical protein I0J43_003680 [Salmonella enterica]|nr:hypothetical protein [Salmonella enterica]
MGERNILADLFRGETLKEIAHKKGLSIKTISALKRRAFTKMQVNSDVNYIHYMYFLKEQRALLTRENLLSSISGPSG